MMNCEVYKDLLVPYMDGTCSEETNQMVKKHLEECESCRRELENYQQELDLEKQVKKEKNDLDKEQRKKSVKPFRKIRWYICCLWGVIALLVLFFGVVANYFYIGELEGYYKADQVYFHVRDENILGAVQEIGEDNIRLMYGRVYFDIIDQEHYYMEKASVEEITEKCKELSAVEFDYANAEIKCSEDGYIEVSVPMHAQGDDVLMGMFLRGRRIGVGKYYFTELQLSRADVAELGYAYQPYITMLMDGFQVWPASYVLEESIDATTAHPLRSETSISAAVMQDTKKTIEPGTYRWENEDGTMWDEFVVYPDQTITRTGNYAEHGSQKYMETLESEDYNYQQLLGRMVLIKEPARYFVVTDETGEERLYITDKPYMGVNNTGISFEINDDGSLNIRNTGVVKRSPYLKVK